MIGSTHRLVDPYADEAVLRVQRLSRPRRCNTRSGKRAAKYFWRVENTSYGKRPAFKLCWNRKLRKLVLKNRS